MTGPSGETNQPERRSENLGYRALWDFDTKEPAMGVLPGPIEELLGTALVGELTVLDERGRPVTHPLIPMYDGELIYLTSSVLFSKKLEHIKANRRVSLS